jgi:hypothetical protein
MTCPRVNGQTNWPTTDVSLDAAAVTQITHRQLSWRPQSLVRDNCATDAALVP